MELILTQESRNAARIEICLAMQNLLLMSKWGSGYTSAQMKEALTKETSRLERLLTIALK